MKKNSGSDITKSKWWIKTLNPSHTCGFQKQRNPGVPCTVPGLRTNREASAPGLLRLPPAASTKATTTTFQRGREKEQDRWHPSSPSPLWVGGETAALRRRGWHAESLPLTHTSSPLAPTQTRCVDDNQVLETGRCSSSTICIHYALTYFAAYSHLMTWRRMETQGREFTFTDHFGPGPGLSAWNTSFCFLVRDEKQKLNRLIPCYVTLGHEAGKRRSWAFLTPQPTLFLPLCPVTPVSSVLQDGVASFLYASLSLSLISSKQKLIFTEIKTRENNMMNNVHKWIGKMRWDLDFKNRGVRFISDKNSRSP